MIWNNFQDILLNKKQGIELCDRIYSWLWFLLIKIIYVYTELRIQKIRKKLVTVEMECVADKIILLFISHTWNIRNFELRHINGVVPLCS